MAYYGNPVGGFCYPKTYILTDEDGNEMATGVVVGEKTVFTATDNDVRLGKVYAGDEGVKTGTKDIPIYYTTSGVVAIPAGSELKIVIEENDRWDYTELQAMICPYNSSIDNSVSVEKVVIKDKVYNSGSTAVVASVTKDATNNAILFGITNNSTKQALIRYITYKEEL